MNHRELLQTELQELFWTYPQIQSYFEEHGIEPISERMPLEAALDALADHWLRDHGLTREQILSDVCRLCSIQTEVSGFHAGEVREIRLCAGTDKSGNAERISVSVARGETVCICGATGSGKTRFLEDVEYIACGDSPTGRVLEVNGSVPTEEERLELESRLCARLSQSMNFVLELSCGDFMEMHARCRNQNLTDESIDRLKREILECANSLAGEPFSSETMITELSGGQSRALMIADLAYISDAPVILIDEPENAGIDRDDILRLLASRGKIVLVSTHDPLIALSCRKRIVIQNGGISAVMERTEEEEQWLEILRQRDRELKEIRHCLRTGKAIGRKVLYEV